MTRASQLQRDRLRPGDGSLDATLSAACRGDRQALGRVLETLQPVLLRIAAYRLGRSDGLGLEVEDVFQEAALLATRHVHTLRARDVPGFVAWFGCVAARIVIRGHRRRRVLAPLEGELGGRAEASVPFRELSRRRFDALGSTERLALVLRRVHELDWASVTWLLERRSIEATRCLEGRARRRLARNAARGP